jgi:hypothetical protein
VKHEHPRTAEKDLNARRLRCSLAVGLMKFGKSAELDLHRSKLTQLSLIQSHSSSMPMVNICWIVARAFFLEHMQLEPPQI